MRTRFSTITLLLASVILLALIAPSTPAQCVKEGAMILNAQYKEGSAMIFVRLSKTITDQDLSTTGTKERWKLENISSGAEIPIDRVAADNPFKLVEFSDVILHLNGPLNVNQIYRVSALSLTFKGCRPSPADLPTEALLKIRKNADPLVPVEKTNFFAFSKAEGREDANIYLKTAVEGTRAGDPAASVDLKYEVPITVNVGADASKGRTGKAVDIVPYFDIKASSAENGDADSMNFGGRFRVPFNVSEINHPTLFKGLRYVLWSPGAGFESDRRFRNVNLTMNNRLTFGIPGNPNTFTWRIRALPFIGYELGRNLRSPVEVGEGRVISRPYLGSALYLIYDIAEDRSFSIQVDYIRRFLLKREFSFKEMENEDKEKVLVPVEAGKGPRDYLKATAEYGFSKFTGFSFSYEYGKLPPLFEKVDHKYGFSLVFKARTTYKP